MALKVSRRDGVGAKWCSERLERGEDSSGIRRGGPDEDVHVVRSTNMTVQNYGPATDEQELRTRLAELDQ